MRQKDAMGENVNNQQRLLQTILQMIQEIIWDTMGVKYIEGNVQKVTKIGLTVKDAMWIHPNLKSEQIIKEKIEFITQYQQRLKDLLDNDDSSISFEQILIS
jgi:hypothetical protein